MPRSAPRWRSRWGASARSDPGAWNVCAAQPHSRGSVRVRCESTAREGSNVRDDWDDEGLLEALRESVRVRLAVPPWFAQTARNAYAWFDIDAQLAQLTYDSSHDKELETTLR